MPWTILLRGLPWTIILEKNFTRNVDDNQSTISFKNRIEVN